MTAFGKTSQVFKGLSTHVIGNMNDLLWWYEWLFSSLLNFTNLSIAMASDLLLTETNGKQEAVLDTELLKRQYLNILGIFLILHQTIDSFIHHRDFVYIMRKETSSGW